MKRPKLLEYLAHLSPAALRRLQKFAASPYHQTDPRVAQLLEILLSHPLPEALDRPALHARLFPGEPYDYDRVTNFISYLIRLVEAFLVAEELSEDAFLKEYLLLRASRRRGFDRSFAEARRRLAAQEAAVRDETDFWQAYQVAREEDWYFLAQDQRSAQNDSLRQRIQSLHLAYLSGMLQQACQWLNRGNIIASDTDLPELAAFLPYLQQQLPYLGEEPLIQLYYHVFMTLTEEQEPRHYQALRRALDTHAPQMAPATLRPLYQFAQNYCIKQVNRGQEDYLHELFDLYSLQLEQGLLHEEGLISAADLKNLVALGVRLGKYAWAEALLEQQVPHITPDHRTEILAYNRAYLLHAQGQPRAALRLLATADFPDLYYGLGVRTLQLKVFYELADAEGLEALLPAFEAYVRRQRRISTYQREAYLHLIRLVRLLNHLRIARPAYSPAAYRGKLRLLEQRIQAAPAVINIGWLRSQLAALQAGA
ncbi:MAG: hypothetical protein OHK0039_10430 [Bacteroidia bacterium]